MTNQTPLLYGIRDDVPFISNRPDDLHCLQAAYGMIRQYYEPEWQIDWGVWSILTGFVAGKGSWSLKGLTWFATHGYDVQHTTSFNYERFAHEGANYLYEALGREAGEWEVKNSDLPTEMKRSLAFLETGMWQHRRPSFEDIKLYLDRGYLIKCIVNQRALNALDGFVGHAVVVIGYDAGGLLIHDPGLPPLPNRHVPYELFLKAWADPNANMEKLDAIRKLS